MVCTKGRKLSEGAAALLRAICTTPADDTPRLVFADYLDEHGDPDRAEVMGDLEHLETRLDLVEARFEAALQRSPREQATRFMVGNRLMLSLLLGVQELLARI